MVGASASQSVDLEFIPLVESYQKNSKNGIHSLGRIVENKPAGSLVASLGKALNGTLPILCENLRSGDPETSEVATPKSTETSRPKYSDTIRFLVNGG